ncbi:MAG: hypothetical protein HPY71_05685 [Firmicutes bacterium]|nr:hypothetical protein [Bacillota bacterium]
METSGAYWHEKYREALDALRRELERKRRLARKEDKGEGEDGGWLIACGFTVNLDMVHKLQSRETGQVIEEVMGEVAAWARDRQARDEQARGPAQGSKRVDEGGPVRISGDGISGYMPGGMPIDIAGGRPGNTGNTSLPRVIRTPQDFIAVLVRLLEEGRGGEWQVATGEMAEWLKVKFPGDFKIGGTGAQAANALSSLGFQCALHAPNLSCGQAKHLNSRIRIPRGGDLLAPLEACRESDPDELHFIIEYDPGLEVTVAGRTIRPVTSNRIILPYDRMLSSFEIDGDFIDYVLNHAPAISSLLVTGFNALRADEDWVDRVDRVAEFVREFRSRNAGALIHLEEGDTRCGEGRRYMIEHLYRMVDSVGMNEDEFRDITGVQADRDPVRSVETLMGLLEAYGLKRVNLHTRDFSLSATRLDPEKEQRAQLVASLLAANRARTGAFGDLEAVARNTSLPLSVRGLDVERRLQESIGLAGGRKEIVLGRQSAGPAQRPVKVQESGQWRDAGEGGVSGRRANGRWSSGRAWIVFSPARNVERPACTVGLGDSYTAGILAMY